tara:strand:- start:556 stop:1266 length:711 start_codon:yes stop_codon:yes gene_type:complete
MTKLSVNINKIASLRNARGGDIPNIVQAAINCQAFGADGITIHPRPDERHITFKDVYDIKSTITTELNIEGYPSENFMKLVLDVLPNQVTLVPDGPNVLTSCEGWNTVQHYKSLKKNISILKDSGIRTSIFVDPDIKIIESAKLCETDRVELYTEKYAIDYLNNPKEAVKLYIAAAKKAKSLEIGVNAGHDLNLQNLKYFAAEVPNLDEVSIGHALISDSLYFGLENTIQMYKRLI